jgi:hypothetical protein
MLTVSVLVLVFLLKTREVAVVDAVVYDLR